MARDLMKGSRTSKATLACVRSRLSGILPAEVASAVWGVDVVKAELMPTEEQAVRRSGPARRVEFARGRACARAAMAVLGAPASAVPRADDRRPLWPAGMVGSISHAGPVVAAATGRRRAVEALGIDVEEDGPLAPEVVRLALTEHDDLPGYPPCVAFSAKESIFKAVYPLVQRWIGFEDVAVFVKAESGRIGARSVSSRDELDIVSELEGRVALAAGMILTAFWLPSEMVPEGVPWKLTSRSS